MNERTSRLFFSCFLAGAVCLSASSDCGSREPAVRSIPPLADGLLKTERLAGEGTWLDPAFKMRFRRARRSRVTVWFEDQLLGDGESYRRRAKEFAGRKRRELRKAVVKTLQAIHARSWKQAGARIEELLDEGKISQVEPHWIVNGFSCLTVQENLQSLRSIPGVKKVFAAAKRPARRPPPGAVAPGFPRTQQEPFDPGRYKHPWYVRSLQADRTWRELGVTGLGTLNVVHDFSFVFSENLEGNLYRNPGEVPANGLDDDRNGFVDDYHGFNFDADTARLTNVPVSLTSSSPRWMHGFMCAAIICGRGVPGKEYEFGIAPQARWAGVIGGGRFERAVQWAVEQGADTYSMSFSIPQLGEYRSHWRKVLEQGSLCGVFFVSGAGNFAESEQVPVQMRVPEDIPEVVFAAAGVQRDFGRTPFSSQGPVKWATEHYRDGMVQKPEVCAFNMGLPFLRRDGTVLDTGLNGNSFAGPMFCGAIALMLSADPDLLPWDLKEVITATATDVAAPGVDAQTGHGLINCYRAVREVLRRKALREGSDTAPFTGRQAGDELDIASARAKLVPQRIRIARVEPGSRAAKAGVQVQDAVLSYNGQLITAPAALRAAVEAARRQEDENILLVVERMGKRIELPVKSGSLGVRTAATFSAPVFK
ncbi:MAG: S8 family serine peptidase [Planctomycetota bacterium]|nr:S8 family serine peptidase [Planctomycetota bacterium]